MEEPPASSLVPPAWEASTPTCRPKRDDAPSDVLYLHGFGQFDRTRCPLYAALCQAAADGQFRLHAPSYHPGGDVAATRLGRFLEELRELAASLPSGRFTAVIGYSVGGLLTALLQERYPELVNRAVLLAPAVDNFARNFDRFPRGSWYMPEEYVEDLRALSARPTIKVPTVLLHGALDDDDGGSCAWRIRQWVATERFVACYFPAGVDHSLEPWLSSTGSPASPPLSDLLAWALHGKSLPASPEFRQTSKTLPDQTTWVR